MSETMLLAKKSSKPKTTRPYIDWKIHPLTVPIDMKADKMTSISDRDGRTPLHYAKGRDEVVKIVNEHPGWIDIQDRDGISPLHA